MGDVDSTAVSGVEVRGYRRGTTSTDSWDQFVIPTKDRITTFWGRANTFLTPGRAAIAQKILALHNATSSTVIVSVNRLRVDVLNTAVKAVGVVPPIIRCHKFTAVPTGGTVLSKVSLDSALSSNSSVTAWGDASVDGTSSGTALTITVPAGSNVSQLWAPRVFTAVGYEPIDSGLFMEGDSDITLRALEGVCVFLDQATVTTGNPTTDRWLATVDWEEYTRP
jgi:hypothetical protein